MQNKENMKKVSLLLLILSVIVIVVALYYPAQPKQQPYLISCAVSNDYNGKTVYLFDKNSDECVDSCAVVDGAFQFGGLLGSPVVYDVIVNRIKGIRATVIVENGTTAQVDMTVRPAKISDNGGYNEKYAALNSVAKGMNRTIDQMSQALRETGKSEEYIDSCAEAAREASLYNMYRNVISENKDNMFGAYFLAVVARDLYTTCEELDSVMSAVKYASGLTPLVDMRTRFHQREITKPGNMFIDFSAFAPDGSVSRLSDYVGKGKYVLVDFWASWCGPCKNEMPNFIEINRQYGSDRFMVLGVNISDVEANFKEAMANLGIDYPQIFVPKKNSDNATVLYNVETIPHTILFGPDGMILERGKLGEELVKTIEGYLK